VASAPGRITSHRAPPHYEELHLIHESAHLFSGKSTKTAATRAALFDSSMHQIVCWLGLHPDHTGGAYSAKGPISKGTGGESGRTGGAQETFKKYFPNVKNVKKRDKNKKNVFYIYGEGREGDGRSSSFAL